eukprot:TRINITY_DN3639_c0_g1_i1.p1 TRINITY_DN3639_c0_g1~~TRINITY_DN3639_c0_g1_i1.p1  ORF type:complete len:362 (-),score=67.91 TRINITY_DN3639_c0_g1_i1:233-1318(-)
MEGLVRERISRDYTVIKVKSSENFKFVNGFQIFHELGRGNYAKVKLCRQLATKKWMAVKIYRKNMIVRKSIQFKETNMINIRREVEALTHLRHPNIIQLHHIADEPACEKLYLFVDYVAGGPIIRAEGCYEPIQPALARHFYHQLVSALDYIHKNGFVHMDVKPENLLVGEGGKIKLIDFGVSTTYEQNTPKVFQLNGTPAFLCPEIISCVPTVGPSIDVWASGICLYMMLLGKHPFEAPTVGSMYRLISSTQPAPTPEELPDPILRSLFGRVFEKDPSKRISASELLENEYFDGYSVGWQVPDQLLIRWFYGWTDKIALIIKIIVKMKAQVRRIRLKKERLRKKSGLSLSLSSETSENPA